MCNFPSSQSIILAEVFGGEAVTWKSISFLGNSFSLVNNSIAIRASSVMRKRMASTNQLKEEKLQLSEEVAFLSYKYGLELEINRKKEFNEYPPTLDQWVSKEVIELYKMVSSPEGQVPGFSHPKLITFPHIMAGSLDSQGPSGVSFQNWGSVPNTFFLSFQPPKLSVMFSRRYIAEIHSKATKYFGKHFEGKTADNYIRTDNFGLLSLSLYKILLRMHLSADELASSIFIIKRNMCSNVNRQVLKDFVGSEAGKLFGPISTQKFHPFINQFQHIEHDRLAISLGTCLFMVIHNYISHTHNKHELMHDIDGAKPIKWMKMSRPCGRPCCG
ncbi:hypothetical protein CR513_16738, partial [Mucuna pruriens]